MEEDIDIEEHDVLDNPRIRDIFPDLSRVKTEAPDPDIDPEYGQSYEEYEQDQEDRFEFEDYTEFDNVESAANFHYNIHLDAQATHEDLPPEHIYHYNNKIILGSKPNTEIYESTASIVDSVDTNVRKESLPATVLLEDWGDELNSSPCYCKECEILFATVNALDAHKMTAHSFLVAISVNKAIKSTTKSAVTQFRNNNVAKKSTGKSFDKDCNKFCNHCNKYFADGTALIKHLYELLPPKNVNPDPSVSKDVDVKANFKCILCNATFPNYHAATMHRKRIHPQHDRLRAISKIVTPEKKILASKSSTKTMVVKRKTVTTLDKIKHIKKAKSIKKETSIHYRYSRKVIIPNPPVPKSVLYKCHLCAVHFASILPACHHKRQCDQVTSYSVCEICNRKIREQDMQIHKLQHSFSNQFNVYKINWDICSRLLCKCPKCGVHSTEMKFWLHWQDGCKEAKHRCDVCDIDLLQSGLLSHKRLHRAKKFTREDFLIVDFLWSDTKKRKQDPEAQHPEPKRVKPNRSVSKTLDANTSSSKYECKKLLLNYCERCKCCFHINSWSLHLASNCSKNRKFLCQTCGLMFTKSSIVSHRKFHKARKVTLHDFKFFSNASNPISPSVPDYHKCRKCRVHYLKPKGQHKCKEINKTCTFCNKKFSLNAHKLHVEFHLYENRNTPSEHKYESLNEMWNILFHCKECNINTDSYDKSVEHSQKHFSGTERVGFVSEQCTICELIFDKTCFTVHQELHQKLPINRNDFLILNYDHTKLLTEDWFQLFGMLPQQKVQQIVSSSMYHYTRDVKLKLVQPGRPECTVYKCKKCHLCVDPNELVDHVHALQTCKKPNEENACYKCKLFFFSFGALKMHMTDHYEKMCEDSFRIIEFNNKSDGLFNNSLKFPSTDKEDEVLPALKDSGDRKAVFKCSRCKIDFTTRTNAVQHRCSKATKTRCRVCGLIYNVQRKTNHELLHDKYPDLCQKNIKITVFNPLRHRGKDMVAKKAHNKVRIPIKKPEKLAKGSLDVAKVYKCPCGLHFTSVKTIEKHIDVCSPEYTVSKENCSKCGLLFDTDTLVNHLCKHHSKNTKIHIEVAKVVEIFECSDCKLLFNSKYELSKHYEECSANCGVKCEVCDLIFHYSAVEEHKSKHAAENLGIVLNKRVNIDRDDENKHVLYRCNVCDSHHLCLKSSQRHFSSGHRNIRNIVPCGICGLRFSGISLCRHIKRDHTTDSFKIEVRDAITDELYSIPEDTENETKSYSEPAVGKELEDEGESEEVDTSADASKINNKNVILYRCSQCDIQHIKLNSWRNHVKRNHKPIKTVTCKLCGLKFHHKSLEAHWRRSHNVKKFRIVVMEPSTRDTFIVTKYAELKNLNNINASTLDAEDSLVDDAMATDDLTPPRAPSPDESLNDNTIDTEASDMETEIETESPSDETNKTEIIESTVFRCNICDIHNIVMKSYNTHALYREHKIGRPIENCVHCGLRFIKPSIDKHILLSHRKKYFRITVIDVVSNTTNIITNVDTANDNPQCEEAVESSVMVSMETEHNKDSGDDLHTEEPSVDIANELEDEESQDAANSSVDSTDVSGSFRSETDALCSTPSIGDKVKLFKCGACNVYYLTQAACHKHALRHVPLDDIDYIECKRCGLQFTTTQIHIHMKKHHKHHFDLDEVLVKEYEPNAISNKAPKIDTYYVKDRIQSRLVSSTKIETKN